MRLFVLFSFAVLLITCSSAEKTEKKAVSETQAAYEQTEKKAGRASGASIERITDDAKLFSLSQEDSLMLLIRRMEEDYGAQAGIYTLDSLMGRSIEDVSIEKAQQLNLGRRDYDDGILITVALRDRKVRIEIGEGLENTISDPRASEIIRTSIGPEFKAGKYFEGVALALNEIYDDLQTASHKKQAD